MTPEHIMQVGLGFWGSKTLLSAVELGVFTELAAGPQEGMALANRLGLHPRGARDFLDALVALGLLERNGRYYANTPETATFLDPAKPGAYVGGMLQMANARLYPFLGIAHRSAAHRPAAERKQDRRQCVREDIQHSGKRARLC